MLAPRRVLSREPIIQAVVAGNLLKRHGMVDELDLMQLKGEAHYYERKTGSDYIHLTGLRCGGVTEIVNEQFDSLNAQLEEDAGFQIVVALLEIGGCCPRCRT